ncbi:hypothetical protein [Phreatobacter sp.]|uniref:hypothetical protein n=1 Tax=Phreatobacter sp. TaxID=1966341 RepID=UPI003F716102
MVAADRSQAENLRAALLALPPSGSGGFEGLLGIILGRLTGQSFRLATSGAQRGRDGDSAFDGGATYFEAKRYRDEVIKSDIASKFFDLWNDDAGKVDLWILGATCEVGAQLATDIRKMAEGAGIGVAILDWLANDLGALLVGVAATPEESKNFIRQRLAGTDHARLIDDALEAIDHFRRHEDFPSRLETLQHALSAEVSGLGQAKQLNRTWLNGVFRSRSRARVTFGQPLAPLDTSGLETASRREEETLKGAVSGRPSGDLYAVIGEEGVGKSWLPVTAWLSCDPQSILIVCPADKAVRSDPASFEKFLITQLIQSTGGEETKIAEVRWSRRLRAWRADPQPENVRVTLVIDGLNQVHGANWGAWLDAAAGALRAIGGCIVVTTRSNHWSRLRRSLVSGVRQIEVPIWTETQLASLLLKSGIDPANVHLDVLTSLRNPRILSLAIELVGAREIERVNDLRVDRLMFEHMRRAESMGVAPLSGADFAVLLSGLAKQVLDRRVEQQNDDVNLFDLRVEPDLEAVATCRFFEAVPRQPSRYGINASGLRLGLALWLVDALERELRNGRNPAERLGAILEPVSALDETAQIAFLATQIACLDEEVSREVQAALLVHFISLQNLPDGDQLVFFDLARKAPTAFLDAIEYVDTSEGYFANASWLLNGLLNSRDDKAVWPAIETSARRWLSWYSVSPERRMFRVRGQGTPEEIAQEREKREAEIKRKLGDLTPVERVYIDTNLVESPRPHFDPLHRTTFYLLAGKPLTSFAPELVRWAFCDALNPAIQAPDKEFRQLIRFNQLDWADTRTALLRELEGFHGNSSIVGNWARVEVLRATGAIDDAAVASELVDCLTRDRDRRPGWSLIEKYCATDPCDPDAPKPDNVEATASSYRDIDPATIANHNGQTSKDHFMKMACAGVARFYLEDAIAAHRALASHALERNGHSLRYAMFRLRDHSAALNKDQADRLLAAGLVSTAGKDADKSERDEWISAQYSILLALPHLAPDEQLEAIANIRCENVLLDLARAALPASRGAVERTLMRVSKDDDTASVTAVLATILWSGAPLSEAALELIRSFLSSGRSSVRAYALAIAAWTGNGDLLRAVVKSDWRASALREEKHSYEAWHGSFALLKAAELGLIEVDETLDRIAADHYGFAAALLGERGASIVAASVDAALTASLRYTAVSDLPEITLDTPEALDRHPPLVSLAESMPPQGIHAQLDRWQETEAAFDARQERMSEAFRQFKNELSRADAMLVLSDLTFEGMKSLTKVNPSLARRWLGMLASAPYRQLQHLHQFAAELAIAAVALDMPGADTLLNRVLSLNPTVHWVQGKAKSPSIILALWREAGSAPLRAICKRRLVAARSDAEIAMEVNAAFFSGRHELVAEVADELIATDQPANICRALMLSGYSDATDHAEAIIARYEETKGFIGMAHKTAKNAYQRNGWARFWFERMRSAAEPQDFWQASVLFLKVVDARFDIWETKLGAGTDTFASFRLTIRNGIQRRIEKWQHKRKDKLFGSGVPEPIFFGFEKMRGSS